MKKTLYIIKTVITWLIVVLAVGMMIFTIVSVTTFDRNDRALFGYKMYIVRSDSMSATDFSAGDLILVKEVDPATLQVGDIVAFTSQNSANFGETVTHKIRSLTTDDKGQPAFVTYGTTTGTDDETVVTYSYVLGKYQKTIPGVGKFFQDLFLWFVTSLPWLVPLAAVITGVVVLIRRGVKKHPERAARRAEKRAAKAEKRAQKAAAKAAEKSAAPTAEPPKSDDT